MKDLNALIVHLNTLLDLKNTMVANVIAVNIELNPMMVSTLLKACIYLVLPLN